MPHPILAPLGAAIALALALPAAAQTSGATDLDAVIVTGTRATDRTALESTSPIDVLTAEDMAEPGDVPAEAAGAPIGRDTPIREVMRMMTETGAEVLPLTGGGRVTRQGIMLRLVAPGARKGGAVED